MFEVDEGVRPGGDIRISSKNNSSNGQRNVKSSLAEKGFSGIWKSGQNQIRKQE